MRTKLIFACFLLLLVACTKKPELSEEEQTMIAVFKEIHMIEATINLNLFNNNDSEAEGYYYQDILEKNDLSNEQFKALLHKYAENSEYYLFVYDSITSQLNRTKNELIKKIEINKQIEIDKQIELDKQKGLEKKNKQ